MSKEVDSLKARIALDTSEPIKGLVHHVNKTVEVTVGELKAAIAANPDHEFAKVYTKAVSFTDDPAQPVFVDKVDLEALLNDKLVVTTVTVENGVRVSRKSLGDSRQPASAVAPVVVDAPATGS